MTITRARASPPRPTATAPGSSRTAGAVRRQTRIPAPIPNGVSTAADTSIFRTTTRRFTPSVPSRRRQSPMRAASFSNTTSRIRTSCRAPRYWRRVRYRSPMCSPPRRTCVSRASRLLPALRERARMWTSTCWATRRKTQTTARWWRSRLRSCRWRAHTRLTLTSRCRCRRANAMRWWRRLTA